MIVGHNILSGSHPERVQATALYIDDNPQAAAYALATPEPFCRLGDKGNPSPEHLAHKITNLPQKVQNVGVLNELNHPVEAYPGNPSAYAELLNKVRGITQNLGRGIRLWAMAPSPDSPLWAEYLRASHHITGLQQLHCYGTNLDGLKHHYDKQKALIGNAKVRVTELNFGWGNTVDRDRWADEALAPFLDWLSTDGLCEAAYYFAWEWPTPDTPGATPVAAQGSRIASIIDNWTNPPIASPQPPTEAPVSTLDADKIKPYWSLIQQYAAQYNLPPYVIGGMVWKESSARPTVVNASSGATGLMQVIPHEKQPAWGRPTQAALKEPATNIKWGCLILADFTRSAGGNLQRGMYRYSGGTVWDSYDEFVERYWDVVQANAAKLKQALPLGESVAGKTLQVPWVSQLDKTHAKYGIGDCGPSALAMLLGYTGKVVTVDRISASLGLAEGYKAVDVNLLAAVAAKFGLGVRNGQAPASDLNKWLKQEIDANRPPIILVDYDKLPYKSDANYHAGHYILVVGHRAARDGTGLEFIYHDSYWLEEGDGAYCWMDDYELHAAWGSTRYFPRAYRYISLSASPVPAPVPSKPQYEVGQGVLTLMKEYRDEPASNELYLFPGGSITIGASGKYLYTWDRATGQVSAWQRAGT